MKIIRLSILCILSFLAYPVLAQNESDVLRLSQYYAGGTARAMSMGGAFGALGADMTSLSINPAGIGAYRSSEFTLTPTLNVDNSKSTFYGNNYSDSKYKFNLNNIGYVYTFNTNKEQGWISTSFGVAYNRLSDFNRNVTIRANNPNSSLLDAFTTTLNKDYLQGKPVTVNQYNNNMTPIENDLAYYYGNYENLAYTTGAIYVDDPSNPKTTNDGGFFINDFKIAKKYGEAQQRIITTKGGIGEYAFSFGANYSHQLYFGATLGIDQVNYEEIKTHTETGIPGDYLSSFTFDDHFKTYGTGYNFKIGAIYRPIELIRLGLAFHTPTFYNLTSEFYTSMSTNYKQAPFTNSSDTYFYDETVLSTYDYTVNSPMKTIVSAALQSKYGLLSIDYEFVNYTKAKIRSDNDPFTDVNDSVQNIYRATGNLKIGGELKLGDYALRAGYGYYGSPYKSNMLNKDACTNSYSFGVGYRGKSFFFDIAYIILNTKYYHTLYNYEARNTSGYYDIISENAKITSNTGRFMATLGFKF